jgi:hypothetical protein
LKQNANYFGPCQSDAKSICKLDLRCVWISRLLRICEQESLPSLSNDIPWLEMLAPQDFRYLADIEVCHQIQAHQLALSGGCPAIPRTSHRFWLQALLSGSPRLFLRTILSFLVCNIRCTGYLRRRGRVGSGAQGGGHGWTVKTFTGPTHVSERTESLFGRGRSALAQSREQ